MAFDEPNPLIKSAIRIAAAGLGAAVAGPLGFALGGILADALGWPAAQLVSSYAEKFGEEAAKKLLDTGTDSLVERLKKSAPDLELVYRQTLRLSLTEIKIHADPEFEDWFANWDICLKTSVQLNLEEIQPSQLTPTKLDELFRRTMERLDAQGAAIKRKSQSLILNTRPGPDPLLAELSTRLPEIFKQNFRVLIVRPDFEQAWKEAELAFRDSLSATIGCIDERTKVLPKVAEDTAAIREDAAATRKDVAELSQGIAVLNQNMADERKMLGGTSGIKREDLLPIIAKQQGRRDQLLEELRSLDALITSLRALVGVPQLEGGEMS
jgi:hypothetical protein